MEGKPHLLTFSSGGYSKPDRFLRQAHESKFFKSISVFSNKEIRPLILSRPLHFFIWRNRGFGFYLWKPRVILKRLRELQENEILVYLDQGFHIQPSGSKTLWAYLNRIETSGSWIGVFSAGDNYRPEFFVRKQPVRRYHPTFYESGFGEYVYAGILIIKNTERARHAIRDWQKMCETTPLWAPIPFRLLQRREFIGQDGDNGYLPVVLDKWGGYLKFDPQEVNLFNSEGFQLHHVLPREDHEGLDWSQMSDKPFLLKRDR